MKWRDRTVAVVGLGVSNLAVMRYLANRGARLVGFDRKSEEDLGGVVDQLRDLGARLVLGPDYLERLDGQWDAVFLTPGMPKNIPVLTALRSRGVPFCSEIGLFFSLCRAPVIGITGSSGKTTTTSLVGEMLKQGSRPVYVGGNIGTPLLEIVESIPDDAWVVLELSSFQLEMVDQSPHIAVITNVTPNHLDLHGTMEAYVAAKKRIYKFQQAADAAVFNADDPTTRAMMAEAPGRRLAFSRRQALDYGAWLDGRHIVARTRNDARPPTKASTDATGPGSRAAVVCTLDDIRLPGWHNVENVLAAVAVASFCGIEEDRIRRAIRQFSGVPHRLELVAEWRGVRFYNDSIATSPARAAAGIRSFDEPVVLIAGGYDKKLPFDELAEALPGRVHTVVLLGATAADIERAILAHAGAAAPRIVHAAGLEEAVAHARLAARPGDVVLLSPACASYDMFPNFEVRGHRFRELVRRFAEAEAAPE